MMRERNAETLYQTLRALSNEHIPDRLIRCIFELRAYCVNWEGPEVSSVWYAEIRKDLKVFQCSKGRSCAVSAIGM